MKLGFELLDYSLKQQTDQIKSIIIAHIHHREDEKFLFSAVLAGELHKDYSVPASYFQKPKGLIPNICDPSTDRKSKRITGLQQNKPE